MAAVRDMAQKKKRKTWACTDVTGEE